MHITGEKETKERRESELSEIACRNSGFQAKTPSQRVEGRPHKTETKSGLCFMERGELDTHSFLH